MTAASSRVRLLVVEDNPANQQLALALLSRAGYDVALVASAREARFAIAAELPDAILMDVELPDQNGLALTRELRQDERTAGVPIIALTANAMRGDEELAYSAGCAGYITKPIDMRHFREVLTTVLSPNVEQ